MHADVLPEGVGTQSSFFNSERKIRGRFVTSKKTGSYFSRSVAVKPCSAPFFAEKGALGANLGVQESASQFSYTAFLGARYAVDKRMSIFAEAGFLTSILTAGFGYRLL